METRSAGLAAIAVIAFTVAPAGGRAEPFAAHPVRVVVFDIAATGVDAEFTAGLTGLVAAGIAGHRGYDLVSQDEVRRAMDQQNVARLDECGGDDACLVRIADAVGADKVVTGSLQPDGSRFKLTLRLSNARGEIRTVEHTETMKHLKNLPLNVRLCLREIFQWNEAAGQPLAPAALPQAQDERGAAPSPPAVAADIHLELLREEALPKAPAAAAGVAVLPNLPSVPELVKGPQEAPAAAAGVSVLPKLPANAELGGG